MIGTLMNGSGRHGRSRGFVIIKIRAFRGRDLVFFARILAGQLGWSVFVPVVLEHNPSLCIAGVYRRNSCVRMCCLW